MEVHDVVPEQDREYVGNHCGYSRGWVARNHAGDAVAADQHMRRRLGRGDRAFRRAARPRVIGAPAGANTQVARPRLSMAGTGRTTSHRQQPGHTTTTSQQPASGDDPPPAHQRDDAARLTPARRELLRRRAAALQARALIEGAITMPMFDAAAKGLSGAERNIVLAWLPPDARAALAADRGGVA